MNNDQFLLELHDYVDKSYSEFQSFQKQIIDMYSVIYDICKKNGIHCYVGFGSLLGIIRDNGMIPWDADIDLLIPINQAENLINILKRELPGDYYLVTNFIDKNYYLCETRICQKGFNSDVMHIDVFYLIGSPNEESQRLKFDKKVKQFFYRRAIRYQPIKKGNTSASKLIFFTKKIIKFIMHIEPNFIFNARCNRILFKYDFSKSEYCIVWAVGGEIFPVKIFEPARLYRYGGLECLLPNDPVTFLRIRYGEFKEYLPVSDRFEEFYAGYKRLNYLYDN